MIKRAFLMFFALAVAIAAFAGGALAQSGPVMLQIKAEQGKILKYSATAGGSLSFNLDGLPFPGAKMTGDNIAASITIDSYFDAQDSADEGTTFVVRGLVKNIILGGLLQISDLGGIGSGPSPSLTVEIAPTGAIGNVQVQNLQMPGGAGGLMKGAIPGMNGMGMDMTSLDTILPIIVGLIPPIFPTQTVSVGDTWSQKVSQEDMPMPIFPIFEFKYKLVSIENGIANIGFTSVGNYDAGFLNNFLSMIPEIPMGTDVMNIKKIDLKMKWDLSGAIALDVAKSLIMDMNMTGTIAVKGDAGIAFTHTDGNVENWPPKLDVSVKLNGGMKYEGEVTRADLDQLFPPPAEEEEAPADDDTGADDSM
jgi:hypothetical protein